MNEEETMESACEKILAKVRAKPSREAIKIIQKELPPFIEEMSQLLYRVIELSRRSEQLLIRVDASHVRINQKVQVSFSAVLGGALLVWVFLSDRIKWTFFLLVAGIPVGALIILIWWLRERRRARDLEVGAERLIENLRRDRDKMESGYAAMRKLLDFVAGEEVSQ